MENFEPHKREIFWYNISVPHERGDLIFDIGSQTLHRRSDLLCNVWRTFGLVHSCIGQNPGSAVLEKPPPTVETAFNRRLPLVGSRVPRDRRPGELRKRIRRPQHVRNSVLVLPRKPLLSRTRQNTVLRRMAIMRRNLFSYASSRLVVVPLGNRVSRVRRFSFPRRSGISRSGRRGKEKAMQ